MRLLAVCVVATVDVVTPRAAQHQPGTELAQAVGLDMATWWKPTEDGYFRHVSKAVLLEAVAQFAPEHLIRLAKLKKADIASEAERWCVRSGWACRRLDGAAGGHEADAAVAVFGVVPGDEGLYPLARFIQTLEGLLRPRWGVFQGAKQGLGVRVDFASK